MPRGMRSACSIGSANSPISMPTCVRCANAPAIVSTKDSTDSTQRRGDVMLAPLESSTRLDDEPNEAREIHHLRIALRASRHRLRRSALQSTRQLLALEAEVLRLQALCDRQSARIERPDAAAVTTGVERRLADLSAANERLREDSRRVALLERALAITEAERRRLSLERDAMARELCRHRNHAPPGSSLHGGHHVTSAA